MAKKMVQTKVSVNNVRNYILRLKKRGKKSVNILDLVVKFNAQPDKIMPIVRALQKEGLVGEE